MDDIFRNLFSYFNYSKEKGFIWTIPTLKKGEHLSIGLDNKRKEFNVHFTDDTIKGQGIHRRNFILTMSSFRFFLLIKRFEVVYQYSLLNLILKSKINPGKLKKHGIILSPLDLSDEHRDNLVKISKRGHKWKFQKDIDHDFLFSSFISNSEIHSCKSNTYQAYKFKGEHLSLQGFVLRLEILKNGLYFIPIKKYNRFQKDIAIYIYNYLNRYPTNETLTFREMMYEKLKSPFPKIEKN